jgi:sugar phosphate isomerase/epimerase
LDLVNKAGAEGICLSAASEGNHCNVNDLLNDPTESKRFQDALAKHQLRVSAFNAAGNPAGGNPLHPKNEKGAESLQKTILLAEKFGIDRVIAFTGLPGDSHNAEHPNWVTANYPSPELADVLKWQWEEVAIPFWSEQAAFARKHNVKVCLELLPCTLVYNTETFLRLREATGENIGVNMDPSHLMWMGMDPIAVVRELASFIYYVHGKDTLYNQRNMNINGYLDPKPFDGVAQRSWIFSKLGDGNPKEWWRKFLKTLKDVGYDDVISVEQEDPRGSREDFLRQDIAFLKELLP